MNRAGQSMVLLLIGGIVSYASLTDIHLRYVKPGLRPFLIAAGVTLIAIALATLWHRSDRADHDDHGDGHTHSHRPVAAWLLVLPVFGVVLATPPALGSDAATRSGTALSHVAAFRRLPDGDPIPLGVRDYAARAAFDAGRSLGMRRVRLTGFVTTGPRGEVYLVRMTLVCCAADGAPIKVGLAGQVPGGLKPDTWVEVIGTYVDKSTKDSINGGIIPYLDVIGLRPVPAPGKQYES